MSEWITDKTPREDGYRMPGEFEAHDGCMMIWPWRPGSWRYEAREARKAFTQVAEAIADSETVYMLVKEELFEQAKQYLSDRIRLIPMLTDDSWARDVGPTFVKNEAGDVRGISWQFNAWGGEYDGLYASWKNDDAVAGNFCTICGIDCYCAQHFVLEGGAIHTDGSGTLLVTEACLLSGGRNPSLNKEQIEAELKRYLSVDKIIWLPRGIYNDETNEHIDNICAFVKPGEVVLAWTDNENDPQYELSHAALRALESERDACGRQIKVHKLYIPDKPILITGEDVDGYTFEDGEEVRTVGERLAASYVNFYISNGGIIVPQFGDARDLDAVNLLKELFPDRKVYPIDAGEILAGGGNIHCITQQIPKRGNRS
ncbi:MAG: agmatine deiminase [bacterium]|nr:agmatine deiminase [bacterium]